MQLWRVRKAGRAAARTLGRLARGQPLAVPGFSSMTLDRDDVEIARELLARPDTWTSDREVERFEQEFARWNGSQHAHAFMGGRVALSACLTALGVGEGDEVIIPGYTCVVVPNACAFAGATPIYADIELETFGVDVAALERALSKRTKAIVIQHLFGLVCRDYEALLALAQRVGLPVIEDCAHAAGAEYQGVKVGNRGELAIYSSEQSKSFCTIQGGLAVTNDESLARKLREYYEQAPLPPGEWIRKQLTNVILNYLQQKHPRRWLTGPLAELRYGDARLISTSAEEERGIRPAHYGCRMPTAIARLGSNQLRKIDDYNHQRRQSAARWDTWCRDHGYRTPGVLPGSQPVYLRYPVLVEPEKKRDTAWAEEALGVELGVWYVSPVHPVERPVPDCPNGWLASERCVNFPSLLA